MPWGFAIAAVGTIASSAIGASAASDAAKDQAEAQQRAMDQATAERKRTFDIGEGYLKPFATLGTEQLPTIRDLLGQGPDGGAAMMSMLEKYPGYQFAVDQGQKAINNQQIAGGSKYSGNALKAAADYSRNMGAGLFDDYFGKVTGIANTGQAAAGGIANLAAGVGSGNANDLYSGNKGIGDANAAGTIGSANQWSNAIDQITGAGSKANWGSLFSTTPSPSSVGSLPIDMPMVGPGSGIGSMASGFVW